MKEHKGVVEERKARVLRKDVEGLAGDQVDVSMVRDLADLNDAGICMSKQINTAEIGN